MNINLANIDFGGAGSAPGPGGQAVWGGITGNISDQTDLMDTLDSQKVSIEGWVEDNFADINSEELAPLYDRQNGYLRYVPYELFLDEKSTYLQGGGEFNAPNLNRGVFEYADDVYMLNMQQGKFYIYNKTKGRFEFHSNVTGLDPTDTNYHTFWSDYEGRLYYANRYEVDVHSGVFTAKNLGGDYQEYTATRNSNIMYWDNNIYMVSSNYNCAYVFDPVNQEFNDQYPVYGGFPANNWYRYFSEFNGRYIYDGGQDQYELVPGTELDLDGPRLKFDWVLLSDRLFPGVWNVEYEGNNVEESTRGVFVHPVYDEGTGDTEWYTFGYRTPVMYRLDMDNNVWEATDYTNVSGYSSNAAGCTFLNLWFGYGYVSGQNGILIWNFGPDVAQQEEYFWDEGILDRIGYIEDYGMQWASPDETDDLEPDFQMIHQKDDKDMLLRWNHYVSDGYDIFEGSVATTGGFYTMVRTYDGGDLIDERYYDVYLPDLQHWPVEQVILEEAYPDIDISDLGIERIIEDPIFFGEVTVVGDNEGLNFNGYSIRPDFAGMVQKEYAELDPEENPGVYGYREYLNSFVLESELPDFIRTAPPMDVAGRYVLTADVSIDPDTDETVVDYHWILEV